MLISTLSIWTAISEYTQLFEVPVLDLKSWHTPLWIDYVMYGLSPWLQYFGGGYILYITDNQIFEDEDKGVPGSESWTWGWLVSSKGVHELEKSTVSQKWV